MPSEVAMATRRLHPFTLVFEAIGVGRHLVLPAIAAALGGGGRDNAERAVTIILGVLAIPAVIAAIARYATFRFRLTGEELVLDSGVLSRRHRVIPLERIQNIGVQQSWLQRLCGVAEVRIETAGGGEQSEAHLRVLARREAEALREELLRGRGAEPMEEGGEAAEPVERLARLTAGELALAGATANEVGIIAATLAGLGQMADELLQSVVNTWPDPDMLVPSAPVLGIALVALALGSLVVSGGWIISIVAAVVGYHDFTLERVGGKLRKRYGLLGRREGIVPLHRVQLIRVEESLLRRPFERASLKIETAGAGPGQAQAQGAEAFVPITRRRDVPRLLRAVYPDVDYDAFEFRPVHPRARRRLWIRSSIPLVLLAGGLALFHHPYWLALLVLEAPLFGIAHLQYRSLGYALLPGYVAARAGFVNRVTWVVPDEKIQTLHVSESPFQRRHGLATVHIDTAGGGILGVARVRDLPRAEAMALLRELEGRIQVVGSRGY